MCMCVCGVLYAHSHISRKGTHLDGMQMPGNWNMQMELSSTWLISPCSHIHTVLRPSGGGREREDHEAGRWKINFREKSGRIIIGKSAGDDKHVCGGLRLLNVMVDAEHLVRDHLACVSVCDFFFATVFSYQVFSIKSMQTLPVIEL